MFTKKLSHEQAVGLLYPSRGPVIPVIDILNPEKILCLSDTANLLAEETDENRSIAKTIAVEYKKAHGEFKNKKLELIQADIHEFSYGSEEHNFGAHLPQNRDEVRREYRTIDNSTYNENTRYDIILGRGVLCYCSDNISCGGIKLDLEYQLNFIQSLLRGEPDLIVLTGNYFPRHPNYHRAGKEKLLLACQQLTNMDGKYEITYTDDHSEISNKILISSNETGYALMILNREKILLTDVPQRTKVFNQKSKALTSNPNLFLTGENPYEIYNNAINLYKTNQFEAAIKQLDLAIDGFIRRGENTSKQRVTCYSTIASCYRELGQMQESIKAIETAITTACRMNIESTEELLKKHGNILAKADQSIDDLYKHAICKFKNQEYHVAINQLKFTLNKINDSNQPGSPMVKASCYSALASCYREIGDTINAVESCNNGLELLRNNKNQKAIELSNSIQKKLNGVNGNMKSTNDRSQCRV